MTSEHCPEEEQDLPEGVVDMPKVAVDSPFGDQVKMTTEMQGVPGGGKTFAARTLMARFISSDYE